MKNRNQIVRVFNKPHEAEGNLATVCFIENIPSDSRQLLQTSSEKQHETGIATTCFYSKLEQGKYAVTCFNDTSAIQCCGHGMIAAAKIIFAKDKLSSITINNNVRASQSEPDCIQLSLPRLSAQIQPVAEWVNELIRYEDKILTPQIAAQTKQNDGYLLLAFEPSLSLDVFRKLTLDLNLIKEKTNKALVVIQFNSKNQHLFLRYFAPQYGVIEDTATGSVMRFVADFIEQRYHATQFNVSQCSSLGGYMEVESKEENIIITANACLEEKP